MADDIMLRSRFVHALGADLEEKRGGYARMSLASQQEHAGADGLVHGGVITTLIDSTLAIALREMRGESAGLHSSVEMNTTFFADAHPGEDIRVDGRIIHFEPAVAFGEAEARRQPDGELLARARVTFAIQQPRP